jgi:AcrR family transcriptional regulator
MAPQKTPTKRRSPITREEGEKRMIDAAIDLIRERPFSEVGVRDIAKRADINHGFVHVWFGSKNL